MAVRKYVSDNRDYIQTTIGGKEYWEIIKGGRKLPIAIEYAAYTSVGIFSKLAREYFNHFKKIDPSLTKMPLFNKNYAWDFIDDITSFEKKITEIGGCVVYFVPEGEKYKIQRSKGLITRIEPPFEFLFH